MSQGKGYARESNGKVLDFGGICTVSPPDRMPPGKFPYGQNIRRYLHGAVTGRATQDSSSVTLPGTVHSLRRLNDLTPAGPDSGFILIGGAGDKLCAGGAQVDSGMSGNPVSLIPFRPNTSVQPWMYVSDSLKMRKVRSDGRCYAMGIAEPQVAPAATFIAGGTDVNQIVYRYVYRSSATGATSNPSPPSVAGTNAGSQYIAGDRVPTDITYNPAQWETVSASPNQLRTTGSATGNPSLLDFVIAKNFGLSVPSNLNITGIKVDLNWASQSSTGATVANAVLYYNGAPIGNAKNPGVTAQIANSDVIAGDNGDLWGAVLTPAIVNSPTFGFAVQVSIQTVRVFLNSFTVTVYCSTQNASLTPAASTDPQVDKIDFYRQGSNLTNYTYVGTGPNSATAFADTLNDSSAIANPILEFDNYQPFPTIDLPRKGTVNVATSAVANAMQVTWVSGDTFNQRWLPGTVMVIGGVACTLYNRPSSSTTLLVQMPSTGVPAAATGLVFEIAQPIIAAQPLPYMWGPTDNVSFMFGVGDPLRPGTLYWTKGNNPDSAPDTNQQDVTSPSEPLQNGCIVAGIGMVFSTERAWLIWPNFFDALATVTGTVGSTWTLQESIADRGLYIPTCLAVDGGKTVFFRTKDGISISPGGVGAKSITDDIDNLFPREGRVPQPVTIGGYTVYPPDDTKPLKQRFSCANGFLYYDYQDVNGTPRTLVFDIATGGWVVDVYQYPVTVHALEEGPNVNGVLTGCSDGTVRPLRNGIGGGGSGGGSGVRTVRLYPTAASVDAFSGVWPGDGDPLTVPVGYSVSRGGLVSQNLLTSSVQGVMTAHLSVDGGDNNGMLQFIWSGPLYPVRMWASLGSFVLPLGVDASKVSAAVLNYRLASNGFVGFKYFQYAKDATNWIGNTTADGNYSVSINNPATVDYTKLWLQIHDEETSNVSLPGWFSVSDVSLDITIPDAPTTPETTAESVLLMPCENAGDVRSEKHFGDLYIEKN